MIAIITFTDPRPTALSIERERALMEKHSALIEELRKAGFEVLDVNERLGKYEALKAGKNFGIDSMDESFRAGEIIAGSSASGIIAGLWHWTESNLVTAMVREAKKPLLLYADDDPAWAGTTCITSVGASLWESRVNEYALNHVRLKGDVEKVKAWARAVEAVSKLSKKSLLLWGAPYTLGMEHLMDDLPGLKRIIGDFIMLDQYILVRKAEKMLSDEMLRVRVEEFYDWLTEEMEVKFDDLMLTPEALRRQIAIYLAAKESWKEQKGVSAVSVKCQPELSEVYGVTACLIPALFPFSLDAEGEKEVVPATCEGDVKGTISSALLFYLSGKPPLFGDIKYVDDEVVMIANCGAASLYYARLSENPEENLKATTVQGQCQGASGGALTYRTPPATFTVARLIRRGGEYYLLYFLAEGIDITEEMESKLRWGRQWPHTAIRNPLDKEGFISVMGANHLSLVPGDYTEELRFTARIWEVKAIDLGDAGEVKSFLEG
ncbi:fucose isomerase [Thermococcus thioreducens]|uniref:Fucose isomerase n=1 Tax=Thermococcus thioreducens TaxID=277988 RepID=A0A0Q2QSB2_9EURY|nr:fucose isomerase [Thermococcus thioreducens]ASJ13036.1 fucose isomerase [Thermococcus thioreducens]KQH82917.1 fucose isomerase [Thermococcus thioreducens]SEV82046.1 L-fucose isomerase [Thermococcus thioreducens]